MGAVHATQTDLTGKYEVGGRREAHFDKENSNSLCLGSALSL